MAINVGNIMQRLRTTRAAQARLSTTWVWKKKTLAQWDVSISELAALLTAHANARAAEDGARGAQKDAVDRLHAKTKLCVGVAKQEFSDDPAASAAFAPLTATRVSLTARLTAAESVATAWSQFGVNWEPAPGFTLTDYNALRTGVDQKRQALETAIAATRQANAQLASLAKNLDKQAKSWYAVATRIFPENTPEGQLLRTELP